MDNRKWTFPALMMTALISAAGAQTVIPFNPALNEFPEGVAIDKAGYLWVTVLDLCQVRRYSPEYHEVLRVNLVSGSCYGAFGLAVNANGTAFVAVVTTDPATRGVYQIEPWGLAQRVPGTGDIEFANGLALDRNKGNLYVTDFARGAVWKIPPGGPAQLWIEGGPLKGDWPVPFAWTHPRGANGITFNKDRVLVAVTWTPRVVSIPVNHDGSAGTPAVLIDSPTFFAAYVWALDGLTLDVHGNLWVAVPAAGSTGTGAIVRVSSDGSDMSIAAGFAQGITASALSLSFGTGKGDRESLFVTVNQSFGGTGSGVVRLPVGVAGMPLP